MLAKLGVKALSGAARTGLRGHRRTNAITPKIATLCQNLASTAIFRPRALLSLSDWLIRCSIDRKTKELHNLRLWEFGPQLADLLIGTDLL